MKSLIKITPKSDIFRKTNMFRWLLILVIILLFYTCQSIDSSNKSDKKIKKVGQNPCGFDKFFSCII